MGFVSTYYEEVIQIYDFNNLASKQFAICELSLDIYLTYLGFIQQQPLL